MSSLKYYRKSSSKKFDLMSNVSFSQFSTQGKLFGTVFVYVSMVFLALPLTIIVGAFSKQYESRKCMSLKKNQSAYQLKEAKSDE